MSESRADDFIYVGSRRHYKLIMCGCLASVICVIILAYVLGGTAASVPCVGHNPCNNGGSCFQYSSSPSNDSASDAAFFCRCLECYVGAHCDILRQDFCKLRCLNGGVCVANATDDCVQTCECPTCTSGSYCEDVSDGCRNNPCHNGGRCQATGYKCDDFICHCTECHLGHDCRVTDEECMRSRARRIQVYGNEIKQNVSIGNLSPDIDVDGNLSQTSKESLLTSIIVVIATLSIFVILVAMATVYWMYRKYKYATRKLTKKDVKTNRTAMLKERLTWGFASIPNDINNMAKSETEGGSDIRKSDAGAGNTDRELGNSNMEVDVNHVSFTNQPPNGFKLDGEYSKLSGEKTRSVSALASGREFKETPILQVYQVKAECETSDDDVMESFDESHDNGDKKRRKRRRRLSPLTMFSNDFASLVSCFKSDDIE